MMNDQSRFTNHESRNGADMRIRRTAYNYLLPLTVLLGVVATGMAAAAVDSEHLPRFVSVFVMEPDRLDAMVWGFTELMLGTQGGGAVPESITGPSKW